MTSDIPLLGPGVSHLYVGGYMPRSQLFLGAFLDSGEMKKKIAYKKVGGGGIWIY